MQQACESFVTLNGDEQSGENPDESAEQTGKVVQNGEVGTRTELAARFRSGGNTTGRRTPGTRSMKGHRSASSDESQEKAVGKQTDRGRWNGKTAMSPVRERSEAHEGRASASFRKGVSGRR